MANKFSSKFVNYTTLFLINFFFQCNLIELVKKYKDFITFITFFKLRYITTLTQSTTNFGVSFMTTVSKILASYIQNREKKICVKIKLKNVKITYNNRKQIAKIT